MPRKFIDVYDLQDHTNEMKTEIVPEIVKEVGGTGGSGTATNIADWAEKGSTVAIPIDKELALPEHVPASEFEGEEHADDTSVSLGSLFNRVFSLIKNEGITYPGAPIDFSTIINKESWASYAEKYPSLFSVFTDSSDTVAGITTTIQKITDTLVNLMSSSGSSSGSSLPIIATTTVRADDGSKVNTVESMGSPFTSTQSYSAYNTASTFSFIEADSENNVKFVDGVAYTNSDDALASAFLDGVFSSSTPTYVTGYSGTASSVSTGVSIHYVFKVTLDGKTTINLGSEEKPNYKIVFTCTAYYLDTDSKGALVVKTAKVKSRTTLPQFNGTW